MTDEEPTPVKEPKRKPNATYLLDMIKARKAYAFRDENGALYVADGSATINRGQWGNWLSMLWWDQKKAPLNEDARKTVIETLEAHAQQENDPEPVFFRVAPTEDGIAIDMATSSWEAIVVTPNGWSIAPTPVRFRRTASMGELPEPAKNGTLGHLAELKRLLNLKDDDQQRLVIGFLLGALNPTGPYPVLGLSGMQGSGKSVTARFVRAILDPVRPTAGNGLKGMTKDEQSFWATAYNAWLPAFDNVSGIGPELSDRLCQLATGAGRSARKLYTDGELFEQSACRPVILNGLELADRPDLLSRTIAIELPRITERATEGWLMERFAKAHPSILGALLDVMAGPNGLLARLSVIPEVKTDGSRLYDHVRWITAAEDALGWARGSYETLFTSAQEAILAGSTDGIVWLDALNDLLLANGGVWDGSATDLLRLLRKGAIANLPEGDRLDQMGWPRSGRGMSAALTRFSEALRSVGIDHQVEFDTHSRTFRHHLVRGNGAKGGAVVAGVAGVAPVYPSVVLSEKKKEGGTQEETPATHANPADEPVLSPTPVRRRNSGSKTYAVTVQPDPEDTRTVAEIMAEIMESLPKEDFDA